MTSIFTLFVDSISSDAVLWWISRATLVMALACAFLALALRARPAARHAIALSGLFAVVLLPVAMAILPTLSLPVLPAVATEPAHRVTSSAPNTFAIDAGEPSAAPGTPIDQSVTNESVANETVAAHVDARTHTHVAGATFDWKRIGALAWLVVAVGMLFRLVVGTARARRVASLATPADDLLLECARVGRIVGLRHLVDVSVSPAITIPMVVGTFRPRVLLPVDALAWSRERLRVVLLHEFAHVSRRDGFWMFAARVVTAVYWFHPLVWILSRHVRREAERACDEIVLASGVRGSEYAGHLVAIARDAATPVSLERAVVTLTTRSSLEDRVVSILSTRVLHNRWSRGARTVAWCGVLVVFAVIAVARPTRVASAQVTTLEELKFVDASCATATDAVQAAVPAVSDAHVVETAVPVAAAAPDLDWVIKTQVEKKMKYYFVKDKDQDNDDDRSGREWYEKASNLYNKERYERAGAAYENAARHGYRRATAMYNAGCSYALAEQDSRALDALRAAFDEGFDDPRLFAEDTDLNSLRDDPRFKQLMSDVMSSGSAESARRSAMRESERLAKRDDVSDGEWNSVGMDFLRSGDYPRAADAFDREFKVSKDEDALYNVACARSLEGKSAEALKLLEQAITTGSIDAGHMTRDPDLMPIRDEPRFDQLVTMAEDLELHSGDWSDIDTWKRWGNSDRSWRKAVPHFEEMTRKYPKVGRAWFNLGYAQIIAEQPENSTASFQRALDLGYQPATTMYNLACATAQSGDKDAAFGWLEKAEKAGMKMWASAHHDDDLDPLRSDARFKTMAKRWKAQAEEDDPDYHWDEDEDDNDDT
jgi:beta-lactamase regulating signal transducer with metallopeptidase domain/tetratricopeptide (TPR) repeat protein